MFSKESINFSMKFIIFSMKFIIFIMKFIIFSQKRTHQLRATRGAHIYPLGRTSNLSETSNQVAVRSLTAPPSPPPTHPPSTARRARATQFVCSFPHRSTGRLPVARMQLRVAIRSALFVSSGIAPKSPPAPSAPLNKKRPLKVQNSSFLMQNSSF